MEESRKNIWLVDSKVVENLFRTLLYTSFILILSYFVCFISSKISDSISLKGLVVRSRMESLQDFKKNWAHEHEPVKDLLDVIKVLKYSASLFHIIYI